MTIFPCVAVNVSIPDATSVGEEEEIVEVCATVSAMEKTERNFTITLTTGGNTGVNSKSLCRTTV
jgi:hypothetical protein